MTASIMSASILQDHAMIGVVVTIAALVVAAAALWVKKQPSRPKALNPDEKVSFQLVAKEVISHDTRKFRFALTSKEHILGLPVGQHISLSYTGPDGKLVSRSYTPVTSDDEIGYVDFVVKIYFAGVHPKFPEGGKMSQYLENLKIGDSIDMRGPKGKLTYVGRGSITIQNRPKEAPEKRFARNIGMIAGGTGITPMLQIVRQALKDKSDKTQFSLIFANQTERDILLRDELETMEATGRVHVWYTLDRPPPDWKQGSGFVNAAMIKKHLPSPGADTQIFMCGPPPMIKFACLPALEELGYTEDMHFTF